MEIDVTSNVIGNKINRYLGGQKLRVLDLFSGCGGLSLGFQRAGYSIVGSVEIDKDAAKSHALNFHKNNDYFENHARAKDIEKANALELLNDFGMRSAINQQIDVIIGGPPCQAFTRIGRAKLREIKQDSNAFLNDTRSQLYKRYLEYVRDLQPLAILMENVPDMLNYGGANIAELVSDDLSAYGYQCRYSLLNSAYYGVPQMRERMFLIAIHNRLATDITFPAPTHYIELPRGYNGSRNVALKNIDLDNPGRYTPTVSNSKLPTALTAQDALSDLPVLTGHLEGAIKKGEKRLCDSLPYSSVLPKNRYQQMMRDWPGYNSDSRVNANVIRVLPRDYPIFGLMAPGDQYPEAHKIAERIFESKIRELGDGISKKTIDNLRSKIVPPYDVTKFPNKWRKMEANMPSRTLMAHLGKDSYSHIHYDSNQARTITVREAARLQSFPDGFVFSGAMNSAFRQIGNAVPPLLAVKLAEAISKMVQKGVARNENPMPFGYSSKQDV